MRERLSNTRWPNQISGKFWDWTDQEGGLENSIDQDDFIRHSRHGLRKLQEVIQTDASIAAIFLQAVASISAS